MHCLLLRTALALPALPGLMAVAVPLRIRPARPAHLWGWRGAILLALGVCLLCWTVMAFYRYGHGTLAPWDPPRHLVAKGPYRFSRNPMYVGVDLMAWGWAVLFRSPLLVAYALVLTTGFHLRVVLGEEPCLARQHGHHWARYKASVPRWFTWPIVW